MTSGGPNLGKPMAAQMDMRMASPLVPELTTGFIGKKKYRETDCSVWFIKNPFLKASSVSS